MLKYNTCINIHTFNESYYKLSFTNILPLLTLFLFESRYFAQHVYEADLQSSLSHVHTN
jgi:hypothetical protein